MKRLILQVTYCREDPPLGLSGKGMPSDVAYVARLQNGCTLTGPHERLLQYIRSCGISGLCSEGELENDVDSYRAATLYGGFKYFHLT